MGMTFLAIGALVLGMYLMMILVKDPKLVKPDSEEGVDNQTDYHQEDTDDVTDNEDPGINQPVELTTAAVAAVAVAIALAQHTGAQIPMSPLKAENNAWDYYVRGHHLSQRSRYEQRRFHK